MFNKIETDHPRRSLTEEDCIQMIKNCNEIIRNYRNNG